MERRVVITGVGMITPLGNSTQETWKNLIEGKSGISHLSRFNPDDYGASSNFPRVAGEVKDFNSKIPEIGKKTIRRAGRVGQYLLASAQEALSDAKIWLEKENPYRVGIHIGSNLGEAHLWEEQLRTLFEKGPDRISPLATLLLCPNLPAGNLSIFLGIKGMNLSSSTACAASAHAIGLAFDQIKLGRADIILAGGTEAPLTPLIVSGFHQLGALSCANSEPEKASRPFDKKRDGFVMSEGAGVLVLEELNRALSRGAQIYGELIGFGMTGDACHLTLPSVEGQRECMRLAITEAQIRLEEIDYINTHGTSTQAGDAIETRAIKELFGEFSYEIPVSSSKSMLGHLLGAAGAVEAAITVLALEQGILPPTINLENPDPECDLDYVAKGARKANFIRIALSNSFGFGGTNACLVFRRFEKEASP